MASVDLNCDVGESYGAWPLGNDAEVLRHVSSANIACGFHAGDPGTMRRTVAIAAGHGVAVGAHPGLPDLAGFGRRVMDISADEVRDLVMYQIGALGVFADAAGTRLTHVKPHGALYSMAAAQPELAAAVAEATRAVDPALLLFGLAGSHLVSAGRAAGLTVVEEAFADRRYRRDGSLAPRSAQGSVIDDVPEAVAQGVRIAAEGMAATVDGADVSVSAGTICVHGDSPHAAVLALRLRDALVRSGITIAAPGGRR